MGDLPLFLALTTVMGLSIFLSMPIVYSKRAQGRWAVGLNAAAIGILVFLLADIFSDVSVILYPNGYVANAGYSIAFAVAFLAAFLALYAIDNAPRGPAADPGGTPRVTAMIIALGIGLQNLTEGLVFGANWVRGAIGILAVVFVGFFLQNVTEGFPIVSPYLGQKNYNLGIVATLFLVGGVPTILGGAVGYFYNNVTLDVLFDALAIGAILYVIVPMLKVAFRHEATPLESYLKQRLVFFGLLTGFLIGFLVNAF